MTRYHIFAETGDVRPPLRGELYVTPDGKVRDCWTDGADMPHIILRRLPLARVLTEEQAEAVRELHDALTGKYHTVTAKTGEDCQCDICQKMMKLRAAFPEIFAPKPQERTVRARVDEVAADVRAKIGREGRLGGVRDTLFTQMTVVADALDALAERVGKLEGR